jgi:hypothetical protein
MKNIAVHRYSDPAQVGWLGWIEPEDKSWIMFIPLEGEPVLFSSRDPETGAVA